MNLTSIIGVGTYFVNLLNLLNSLAIFPSSLFIFLSLEKVMFTYFFNKVSAVYFKKTDIL